MKTIHILMCYKHISGMKYHVWVATLKLAKPWHKAQVFCEHYADEIRQGIEVHERGTMTCHPRWYYCWRFGYSIKKWLSAHLQPRWLIHIHKLDNMLHIVAFRCTPFALAGNKP